MSVSLTPKPTMDPWVRVHWAVRGPLEFRIATGSGTRFNPLTPPWQSSSVIYAGSTLEVAVAETILRWRDQIAGTAPVILSTRTQLEPRSVSWFVAKRPVEIIDITGFGLKQIQGVIDEVVALPVNRTSWASRPAPMVDDIFQCSSAQYPITQAWGTWFRSQCPKADGIRWVSRQFNTGQCIVLFGDRCAGALTVQGPPQSLLAPGSAQQVLLDELLLEIGWSRD